MYTYGSTLKSHGKQGDNHAGITKSALLRHINTIAPRMHYLNKILENFWKRWRAEYLTGLRVIKSAVQMGRVEKLLQGSDGVVRGANLQVQSGTRNLIMLRPTSTASLSIRNIGNACVVED